MEKRFETGYCRSAPSTQTAVDVFRGLWKSSFPVGEKVQAGNTPNFEDPRVAWVDALIGGVRGRSVLELGPFEAYNTYQLALRGASPVVAVEGNNVNYLKCLVVKETLGVQASFLHGDILEFLKETRKTFDLVWAAGVLYHQLDPLLVLKYVTRVCNRIFIWTHFFDPRIEENTEEYPHFDRDQDVEKEVEGYRCTHHYRSYRRREKTVPAFFSGGNSSFAYWLEKDDILNFLKECGFEHVSIRGIQMKHKAGPTMSLLAERST